MIEKSTYIFSGGDSDGLLGAATILKKVNDAFFSFTSPRTLDSLISDLVRGATGDIYIRLECTISREAQSTHISLRLT